ncbi:MAG: hypothetical protein HY707_13965 [Ignavibacteriae bacterium]|nr:hypothetical protein [Ignavibacteriota bacterium]
MNDQWDLFFDSLPGGEILRKGIRDLQEEVTSIPALLLLIGGPRLRNLGLSVLEIDSNPEHALYDLLSQEDPDSAHSRYNALIRTLVSFERAAECAKR